MQKKNQSLRISYGKPDRRRREEMDFLLLMRTNQMHIFVV